MAGACPSKKTGGGAYIMVIAASLMVFSLVLAAFTITTSSRNITARYGYFYAMYDIAVAGNQQAFFLLKNELSHRREYITSLAQQYAYEHTGYALLYRQFFIDKITPYLSAELRRYFPYGEGTTYRRSWTLSANFSSYDISVTDTFYATTVVSSRASDGFMINTTVHRQAGNQPAISARVQSNVDWKELDYYTLTMVELLRIAD